MIADLAALLLRHPPRLVQTVPITTADFEPVNLRDRVGEVCMVIRQADGRLLTAAKTIYPPDAHRLLTGGIRPGEPVLAALEREIAEETGLATIFRQVLAVARYTDERGQLRFTTVACLVDAPHGTPVCHDAAEQHSHFMPITVGALLERAAVLSQVAPTFQSASPNDWVAWGHFRAIIHRAVWMALQPAPPLSRKR